jgi:choline dehydrogenase-like flavoprotein
MATIVVIGAGLAGSLIASRLASHHHVVVIEQSQRTMPLRVFDRGRPAVLDPHVAAGLGGTSAYWHNGLIELAASDYAAWPLPAAELDRFVPAAHEALSGATHARVAKLQAGRATVRGDPVVTTRLHDSRVFCRRGGCVARGECRGAALRPSSAASRARADDGRVRGVSRMRR